MNRVDYSHMTALVVEKDSSQREAVRLVLDEFGITTRFSACPAEMVAAVRTAKIDLLLVELGPGGDDGHMVIEALREAGYDGPVVAIASDLAGSTFYMDVMERFDACVAKPLNASAMIRTLRQIL